MKGRVGDHELCYFPFSILNLPAITMFLFGITGGIGSGKSTICEFLRKRDIPIIAADPLAKRLTNELSEIRKALTNKFGAEVYTETGELNRDKLSAIVFSDEAARQRVNEIIHPHVFNWIQGEVARLQNEEERTLVGVEAALIYESEMEKILDAVVVVTAPLERRIDWIAGRDQLSQSDIRKRIDAQMPISEKVRRADYVIENNGTLADLETQVDDLHKWLLSQTK